MNPKDFCEKLAGLPMVEPDQEDVRALAAMDPNEQGGVELEEFKATVEHNGKLSLRIPKSLHRELSEQAKREGVSLNQYALYRLTRSQPHQNP